MLVVGRFCRDLHNDRVYRDFVSLFVVWGPFILQYICSHLSPQITIGVPCRPGVTRFVSKDHYLLVYVREYCTGATLIARLVTVISIGTSTRTLQLVGFMMMSLKLQVVVQQVTHPTTKLIRGLTRSGV